MGLDKTLRSNPPPLVHTQSPNFHLYLGVLVLSPRPVAGITASSDRACKFDMERGATPMSYITSIMAENALDPVERPSTPSVKPHHATDAARILLARSPTHARRFALAMHKRMARGLNSELIEHWARVVTEISRLSQPGR
jgi:hypothetical protein